MPPDLNLQNTRPKTLATADPPTMMSMMPTSALSTRGRNRLAMAVPIGMPAATATLMTAERPTSSELRRAATRKAQMPFGMRGRLAREREETAGATEPRWIHSE